MDNGKNVKEEKEGKNDGKEGSNKKVRREGLGINSKGKR